jgi:hypothetical protein
MSAHHEACILLLAWEWWLGHQKLIKASSTIALLVLAAAILADIISVPFRKNK